MTKRHHYKAKCEECPLYEENTFVPSTGNESAGVVLVGEAPGAQEVRTGEPFTGPSGKLLNILLAGVDIERSDVYITNTCLCRPRDNSNPPAAAVKACAERLEHEIRMVNPHTIVTLGNFASKAILQTNEGITRTRVGPPKETTRFPGSVVIPTYHPAASLYNQSVFPDIVTDFGKIRPQGGTVDNWTPPYVEIHDDPDGAATRLRELCDSEQRYFAIDIEVGIEKDVDFDHPDRYRMLCIGVSGAPGEAIVFGENACASDNFKSALGLFLSTKELIAQNGKFDIQGLWPYGRGTLYFDTMLAHYCLDERRGTHSLDQLAIENLGAPDWKDEIKRYLGPEKNYADIPRDALYKYNAYDVANTYDLYEVFAERLEEEGLRPVHDFLVRASNTLMHMERNGVSVDEAYLDTLEREYEELLAEGERYLRQWVDNPRSPKQVKEALEVLGVRRVKSTDRETLEGLQERAALKGQDRLFKFTSAMLEYRRDQKLYGTYIKGIRTRVHEGRVYPTFLLHGTVSGRLSARNPNIQNIPRGSIARRLFVPSSPDNVIVQADYGQAELRVVCAMARDAYLRDVFSNPDRDIHGEVATRFYGPDWTKEQRVRAKAVVFGLTYGREAYSLAAEHNMSVQEAQTYINQFFELIPDTVSWIANVEQDVLDGKDLVTPFGRRRRFWLITETNKHSVLKEARSFLPQSTASDLTLESAIRLHEAGFTDYLRFPVHDAIVMDVPKSEIANITEEMRRIMENVGREVFDDYIPFPVDVEYGKSWGDIK